MDLIELIGSNEKAFTVMVAFIAIFGGIAGNWIGAWLQSRAGRAQASAARDAAWITAEAQRLAALHTDRRELLARVVVTARQAHAKISAAFLPRSDGSDAESGIAQIGAQVDQLVYEVAELSLVTPEAIVRHAERLRESISEFYILLGLRGEARRAQVRLDRAVGAEARRAREMLVLLRESYAAQSEEDVETFRPAARQALHDVPALGDSEVEALVNDAAEPPVQPLLQEAHKAPLSSLGALVAEARRLLAAESVTTRPE
ncbi:hypothetical protein ACWGJT_03330 [Streptomyces xantholiticus]